MQNKPLPTLYPVPTESHNTVIVKNPTMFAHREHRFCYGHTVFQHEGQCAHIHGHEGVVTFHCATEHLDSVGRVIDFSVIKEKLCMWLEDNWDHKFLVFKDDPKAPLLVGADPEGTIVVPFNPTAENLAAHLLDVIGPQQLKGTGVTLTRVDFMETSKCGVSVVRT